MAPNVLKVPGMTKLLAVATLLFVACSDTTPTATANPPALSATGTGQPLPASPSPTTPSAESLTGGEGEPSVDPTIPSWTPKSCIAYHAAVVGALECTAVNQTKRDEIQRAYGLASQRWKAETDGTPTKIQQIADACELSTLSIRADMSGKCALAKS